MNPETIIVIAESLLSLYPILLKLNPLPISAHILSRFGTYTASAGALASPGDWNQTWGSLNSVLMTFLSGLMTIVHVGSSYVSYRHLEAGNALALFYIYPFLNVLGGILFYGETLALHLVPLFLLAFAGVLLIGASENETPSSELQKNRNVKLGISMALLSALTETLIYFVVKTSSRLNPYVSMLQLYSAGFIGLVGFEAYKGFPSFSGVGLEWSKWLQLIAFNVFIGFFGHVLQFYSIPKLATAIFSLLAFIGVGAGYGWGLLFANEKPSMKALLGAGCITFATAALQFIKGKGGL
jgi:drug/metabolite transporter (DMT)-like permease